MAGFKRKVIGKHPRREDLEVHVSSLSFEGDNYVEIREYIPSLGAYGRGVLIPTDMAARVVDDLSKVGG